MLASADVAQAFALRSWHPQPHSSYPANVRGTPSERRAPEERIALSLTIVLFMIPVSAFGQTCVDTAGFLTLSGKDTVLVERVEVSGTRVAGVQVSVDGLTVYSIDRDSRSGASRGALSMWAAGSSPPAAPTQRGELIAEGRVATFKVYSPTRALQTQIDTIVPGALMRLQAAIGLDEAFVRLARTHGTTVVDVPSYSIATGGYAPIIRLRFVGADSAVFRADETTVNMHIDSAGRILGARYRTGQYEPTDVVRVSCSVVDMLIQKRGVRNP